MSERRKGERDFLGTEQSPYSKGVMARALTAIGVREEQAREQIGRAHV